MAYAINNPGDTVLGFKPCGPKFEIMIIARIIARLSYCKVKKKKLQELSEVLAAGSNQN